MDELKIYIKISGIEIPENTEFQYLDDIAEKCKYATLEKMKYKLMWIIRSIETEFKQSGGIIIIELVDSENNIKFDVTTRGLSEDMILKVNLLCTGVSL